MDAFTGISWLELRSYMLNTLLRDTDGMSMCHSLEVRVPFLDHRLVEFAASLPVDWKLNGLRQKYLLRRSQRRYLPARVIDGRKQGFNAPVSSWIDGPLAELVAATLSSGPLLDWFERAAIDRLLAEHRARRRDHGLAIFGLTCLGLWLEAG